MKKTLLSTIVFLPLALSAQRLEVIASGGQYLSRKGISITATIGEVCVSRPSGNESYGTEGFQQGFKASQDLPGSAIDRNRAESAIQAQLFPNPAIDYVQVALQNPKGQSVHLRLYNNMGLLLQETETRNELHSFDIGLLSAGRYLIALQFAEDEPIITLPFAKISR